MELELLRTFRQTTNTVYLFRHQGRQVLAKRYLGEDAPDRRNREESRLRRWAAAGFSVPRVMELTVSEFNSEPHLVLEFLEAVTLQEWLKNEGVPTETKLGRLTAIFEENHRRHRLAMSRGDAELIHADANTSNVLCRDQQFFFIDFENSVEKKAVAELAALEIAKFCRWAARDLGIQHLPRMMHHLVETYAGEAALLQTIVDRTRGRSLGYLHRWRDHRRKKQNPREVTKYDVADALARALPPSHLPRP
jgi:tRNA A-37 threonylcarbamoyl transferase component Bud32